MRRRWAMLGVMAAKENFRRIKGYREMPFLIEALNPAVDGAEKAPAKC